MSDLINREDAIEAWDKLSKRGRTEFDQVLMTLPSAEVEWIPCNERLPSESGDYLCTIPLDTCETYTKVLTFYKGKFYEDDIDEWGAMYHDDVLARMPLPKSYKMKSEVEK